MRLDEYMSVKGNLEDKSTPSENLRGNLRVESKVTQSETDHPPERVSESTELAKDTREIDSELERALDEFGTRKVKMYSPEFRGREVSSEEELQNVIDRDIPGIKEHRNYEKMMEQAVNHFKAEERFGHRKMVSSGELVKFSEEINEPERTVRSWVVEGASPLMYPTLESAMTKQEAEEKIGKVREKLQGVDSYEKLQERLDHPYHETHTKTQVSYPKDLESTRKYYDFLDEMAKGGTIADVSRRVGFTQANGSRYLEGRIARLINRAIEPVPDFEPVEVKEKYRIDSPEKYERALERHPFVKDLLDFAELDHEARAYTHLMGLKGKGELPDKMVKDLADEYDVGKQRLASWLSERKTQELVHRLEMYEQARDSHEAKLPKEAFEHRIDPSTVYENFRHLRDVKNPTTNELAELLEKLLKSSGLNTKVQWAELKEYHYGGPKWLREVATKIAGDRETTESALNQRMGLDTNPDDMIRLGVLDSKVYMRRADTSEWNWLNIYKNEAFYFESQAEKNRLVDEAKSRLGIQGGTRLSQITAQLTDKKRRVTSGQPDYDLNRSTHHLRGETLALVLDTTGKKIQDVEKQIERIGQVKQGRGGISDLRFPENKTEIDSMFAIVLGAGLSDGHVARENKGFIYTESNRERVDIFYEEVSKFGGVYRNERIRDNGVIEVRFSSVYGRALEKRGLISGDKALQNEGFQDWLKDNPELAPKYLGPMWAQDGNFYVDPNGSARFQWDRAVVLRDPSKESEYDHHSKLNDSHAELIKDYGSLRESEGFKKMYQISRGDLEDFEESSNPVISELAGDLLRSAYENPSHLMNDEVEQLKSLGVAAKPTLRSLTYYENTGRISSLWHAYTKNNDDAMRVSLQCPPDDELKRNKVEEWMKRNPERLAQVKKELDSRILDEGDEL